MLPFNNFLWVLQILPQDTKISVMVKKGGLNCLLIVILAMISINQQNISFYRLSIEALEFVLDEKCVDFPLR